MLMQNVYVVSENASIPYIVKWIKQLTIRAAKNPEIKQIAVEASKSENVLKYIFDYSYDKILYVPNEGKKQQLRTDFNFLKDSIGNCTTYTTLIGAVLLILGIPFKYRVANYWEIDKITGKKIPPKEWQHIYIVTKDGTILDPVIGQKQDGTDTRNNRPRCGEFNKELQYYKKTDYPMARLEILQGALQGNRNLKYIITNRSKMSRYGLLGCSDGCGCGNNLTPEQYEVLGKTIVGKFLKKAGNTVVDVGHIVANTIVSPVEALTGKQIVGPNYHSDFAEKVDKGYTKILTKVGDVAAAVFTAGAVDFKNPYEVQAEKDAALAQQQFDILNDQPPTEPKTGGIGIIPMLLLGSAALGFMMYDSKPKKKRRKK